MRVLSDVQAIHIRAPYGGEGSGPNSLRYKAKGVLATLGFGQTTDSTSSGIFGYNVIAIMFD